MKILLRTLAILSLVYLVFWGSVAAYFSYAERHKGLLESNLTAVFERTVTIDRVRTDWRGTSPRVQIVGFQVAGDVDGEPALAFDTLSAELSLFSVLRLWPEFTELAIDKPVLEIVSLGTNNLQIAGLKKSSNSTAKEGPRKGIFEWLITHKNIALHNGEIVWRRLNGEVQRYTDMSFVFERQQQQRNVQTTISTPKGALAFSAQANGDVFADSDWDASLEVLGNEGQRLLTADDFSLNVVAGEGDLSLKTLDIERIRDFIRLTGIAGKTKWFLDAQLSGRLHDMQFMFSGPLFEMDAWTLQASASDIGFRSTETVPAMNNMQGTLKASASGGSFVFATENALFEWSSLFDQGFPIDRAAGDFGWSIEDDGDVTVTLQNGEFEDQNAKIFNINARCTIDNQTRKVTSFAQLFKVDSVADISYEDGEMVTLGSHASSLGGPLFLDASAEFEVSNMAGLHGYLPNKKSLGAFRSWSKQAFLGGAISNGKVSYRGEVSKSAMSVGKAQLNATADFSDVIVDYAPKLRWPRVEKAAGSSSIRNDLLTIKPDSIWLNGDPVSDGVLQIESLFSIDRTLSVTGKTTTSLKKGMDFVFKGPLVALDKVPDQLPLAADAGSVDIATSVSMQLKNTNDFTVKGTAKIREGAGVLPGDVPMSNISGDVHFTENTIESENVRATFLGGETRGRLVTIEAARPPIMKLIATGTVHAERLEPWVGEHILTLFEGAAPWQGELLVDGSKVAISGSSNLQGIAVNAPAPLTKSAQEKGSLELSMTLGNKDIQRQLAFTYNDSMQARFAANLKQKGSIKVPSLFDNSLISFGGELNQQLQPGINFNIAHDQANLDEWLSAVIDLASYQPKRPVDNTVFLDAMRSVKISADDPTFLGRQFGLIDIAAFSVDGIYWIGTVEGENIAGTMQLQPRASTADYAFKLDHFNLVKEQDPDLPPEPIDYSLTADQYPAISLVINQLRLAGKTLGHLQMAGTPVDDEWRLNELSLEHNGIKTTAQGAWKNDKESGSMSSFDFSSVIEEAEGALNELDFDGIIKKGDGSITGNVSWIGAPHEFDYARLNGDFDMRISDGELVQVAPGSGKLLGLLNSNAILRRVIFDFRDVFASGLKFDRMRYTGLFANGEAILRDAFIFSPAAFIRMEGKLDLDKELIDMEVHVAPELGGNLALLSALANPAAGAVVFLTQRLFKDEMRNSSFRSYRALGTWEDFEMVEILDSVGEQGAELNNNPPQSSESKTTDLPVTGAAQVEGTPTADQRYGIVDQAIP